MDSCVDKIPNVNASYGFASFPLVFRRTNACSSSSWLIRSIVPNLLALKCSALRVLALELVPLAYLSRRKILKDSFILAGTRDRQSYPCERLAQQSSITQFT